MYTDYTDVQLSITTAGAARKLTDVMEKDHQMFLTADCIKKFFKKHPQNIHPDIFISGQTPQVVLEHEYPGLHI